jgi:excisionase family DNA binding protein
MSTGRDTLTLGSALRIAAEQLLLAADAADRDQVPELLTPKQVAAIFTVSVQTIYRWIAAGDLEAVRVGETYRIPLDAVKARAS